MKDTYTRIKEKHEAEARKMVREASIICGTIIVLASIVILVLAHLQ